MLGKATKPIVDKKLGRKDKKMTYSNVKGKKVDIVPTSQKEHDNFCL
jgi:phosphoenolpyruvate synthase/pyruvate phosphate dikinase